MEYIDFLFTIPYPTRIQRIETFEKLLEDLSIHTVDITHLADLTEEVWNVHDLERLVNMAFIQWKILNYAEFKTKLDDQEELKEEDSKKVTTSLYKIPLTAEIFADLIKNNQIQPIGSYLSYKESGPRGKTALQIMGKKKQQSISSTPFKQTVESMEGLSLTDIDSFTSSQLYQYAASNKFEELTVILEKLAQVKRLDEIDRKTLADYAFILKDDPQRALLKLTNAKKTIDRIQKLTNR
jgi:hypothetical protein